MGGERTASDSIVFHPPDMVDSEAVMTFGWKREDEVMGRQAGAPYLRILECLGTRANLNLNIRNTLVKVKGYD
jgi:hypothetical protein